MLHLRKGKWALSLRTLAARETTCFVLQAASAQEDEQKLQGPRDALTPRCRAVLPLLSAASAVDPFSSRRWTQSTWPFMIASISGVLQEGEAAGLGNQLRSSIALSPLSQPPRKGDPVPHRSHRKHPNSLAVDVHDVGDVCPLPAVYQEVQGISVPVGSWRQGTRKGGVTHTYRRVPPFQPPPQNQRKGLVPSSQAHVAEQIRYVVARLQD